MDIGRITFGPAMERSVIIPGEGVKLPLTTPESTAQREELARLREENRKLRAALSALAPICWRINDETDRSEGDRYYLASTNDWHDLHDALHQHADTIRSVERGAGHASDCAVHNEPACPSGPCDCGLA